MRDLYKLVKISQGFSVHIGIKENRYKVTLKKKKGTQWSLRSVGDVIRKLVHYFIFGGSCDKIKTF